MQHGIRTKYHLTDFNWTYGEIKWMNHAWARRGHTQFSHYLHFWKREYRQRERRRGKAEAQAGLDASADEPVDDPV
jgi:hypothetical protein